MTDARAAEHVAIPGYDVGERIGAGGFGEVFRARHLLMERDVAIKVLHRSYSSEPDTVARFVAEARAVARLSHPNIVEVFDFGELADGRHYCVMELLRGRSLREVLRERVRLPLAEALPMLRGIAEAVDAAHAAGIAHRDLKPDNVFVVDGGIRLIDFGLAKVTTNEPIEAATSDLALGDRVQLTARAYDAGGRLLTDQAFTWTTDAAGVATVTADGLVTAVGAGEVIISAGADLVTGGVLLTVVDDAPAIDRIELEPGGAVVLLPGETLQLAATAYAANGDVLLDRPMTWGSDDTSVATVSATGLVTGIGPGSARIAVVSEDRRAELVVQLPTLGDHTLMELGGAPLPTLLGSYTEVHPELGTFIRTLRVFSGGISVDPAGQTYEAVVSATMATQSQPSSVPIVVRLESSGTVHWDAATSAYLFQPADGGDAFTGRWVATGLQVQWQPEPRIAGVSTFLFGMALANE